MRGLALLFAVLVAMPVGAQTPCPSLPGPATVPVRPAPVAPPAGSQGPPDALCAQLHDIAVRLARIEAQQQREADRKPVVVTVLGNRYVELALVAASAFFTGWKLR